MKRVLSLIFIAILMLAITPNQQKANASDLEKYGEYEKDIEFEEITINEEFVPNTDILDPSTSVNAGITEFFPDRSTEIVPTGLSFSRGTVSCYTIKKNAYCPWTIQVGGDLINYSKVKVEIQKHQGISKGWISHKNFTFDYVINRPSATIRNEASTTLTAGSYRTRLGGSFRTIKNGWYGAWANGWSYFEVK